MKRLYKKELDFSGLREESGVHVPCRVPQMRTLLPYHHAPHESVTVPSIFVTTDLSKPGHWNGFGAQLPLFLLFSPSPEDGVGQLQRPGAQAAVAGDGGAVAGGAVPQPLL